MKSQTARDRLMLAAAVALGSLSVLGAALTIHHYQERRRLLLSGPRRIPKRVHKVREELMVPMPSSGGVGLRSLAIVSVLRTPWENQKNTRGRRASWGCPSSLRSSTDRGVGR